MAMIGPEKVPVEFDQERVPVRPGGHKAKKFLIEGQCGDYDKIEQMHSLFRRPKYKHPFYLFLPETHGEERWETADKFPSLRGALDSLNFRYPTNRGVDRGNFMRQWSNYTRTSAHRVVDPDGIVHAIWYPRFVGPFSKGKLALWVDVDGKTMDVHALERESDAGKLDWVLCRVKGWYGLWPARGETLLTYTERKHDDWSWPWHVAQAPGV